MTKLRPYFYVIGAIMLLACGLIFINYAWLLFATVTSRSGLNGDMSSYYQMSKITFSTYVSLIAVAALLIIDRLIFSLSKHDKPKLTTTFIQFLCFVAIMTACEIYLSSRFIGKG